MTNSKAGAYFKKWIMLTPRKRKSISSRRTTGAPRGRSKGSLKRSSMRSMIQQARCRANRYLLGVLRAHYLSGLMQLQDQGLCHIEDQYVLTTRMLDQDGLKVLISVSQSLCLNNKQTRLILKLTSWQKRSRRCRRLLNFQLT